MVDYRTHQTVDRKYHRSSITGLRIQSAYRIRFILRIIKCQTVSSSILFTSSFSVSETIFVGIMRMGRWRRSPSQSPQKKSSWLRDARNIHRGRSSATALRPPVGKTQCALFVANMYRPDVGTDSARSLFNLKTESKGVLLEACDGIFQRHLCRDKCLRHEITLVVRKRTIIRVLSQRLITAAMPMNCWLCFADKTTSIKKEGVRSPPYGI